MTVSTRDDMTSDAQTIHDETTENANTANRVGQMFLDIIDSMRLLADHYTATAVATSNIATLSGTSETQDGIALNSAGVHICLCTGQTSADENGPWVIQSGPWTRPDWFATGTNAGGFVIDVQQGTTYADSRWHCTSDDPNAVVDTDNLTWALVELDDAPEYASISVEGNTAAAGVTATGTPVQFTHFDTNGPYDGATPDHANDHITIGATGVYRVAFHATVEANGADKYRLQAEKNNGATSLDVLNDCESTDVGDYCAVSASNFVSLTAADTVELWITNLSGTNDVYIRNACLSVERVDRS